jgi:hypothetical protein
MTGYELSKNWFDWAFENPDINSPTHTALYLWAVEKWNRLSQKEKFGFPASEAMEVLGIKSYNTYKKVFNELVKIGAIKLIQESKNQYSANIIALSKFNKAHDKALAKHMTKQVQSTSESIDSIDKPLTINQELINNPKPVAIKQIDYMGLQIPIETWLKYKKSKGQTYKDEGSIKALIKKLYKFSSGKPDLAQLIIEDAMSLNYSGFFELKPTSPLFQQNGFVAPEQIKNPRSRP